MNEFGGPRGFILFTVGLFRLGTQPACLLVSSAALLALAAVDCVAAYRAGIDFENVYALTLDGRWLAELFWVTAGLGGVCLLAACVAGLVAAVLPDNRHRYDETRRASKHWLRSIMGIALLAACVAAWLAPAITCRAGPEVSVNGTLSAYTSWSAWLLDTRGGRPLLMVSTVVSMIGTLGLSIISNMATGSTGEWLLRRYKRVQMLGLRWPSMPRRGRQEFDVARLAPQLARLTNRIEIDVLDEERRGSLDRGAGEGLKRIAGEIESSLRILKFAPRASPETYCLEFTSSNWRALEVALRRTDKSRVIVVSPFERDETHKEVQRALDGGAWRLVFVQRPVDLVTGQLSDVAARAAAATKAELDKTGLQAPVVVTIVVSLVDHVSGRVVPVAGFRSALESLIGPGQVDVIIDGTQAFGNLGAEVPDFNFAALCCPAHKWMMSPYYGAFVWSREAAVQKYAPMDVWSKATNSIRVDVRTLLALRTACGFWVHFTPGEIYLRLRALRKQLVTELEPELVEAYAAGSPSPPGECSLPETGIVYVMPGVGLRWTLPEADLERSLTQDGLHAAVVTVDGGASAVRLCVSTVTDGYQVLEANKVLRKYVGA